MDDQALIPNQPNVEPEVAEEQAQDEALLEDTKVAQAYYHPAWEFVESYINDRVEQLRKYPSTELPADEFKSTALGNIFAASEMLNLMDHIKNAVANIEQSKRA